MSNRGARYASFIRHPNPCSDLCQFARVRASLALTWRPGSTGAAWRGAVRTPEGPAIIRCWALDPGSGPAL